MRAIAAVVILAAFSLRSRAHADPSSGRDVTHTPVEILLKCARTLGPSKCLAALSYWRAENAINSIKEENFKADFSKDVESFPWERYANSTDDELYSQLCTGTEKLLRYKALNFNMVPGYEIQLASRGNGTLNIDVFNSPETESSRGMKKMRKVFYKIVPFMLLPGLLMSAILPFVLPALKMMTVAVGMLNNMALSGAIFTLLRNNAFNDKYDHKIIYVNEGYSNEKHAHKHHHDQEYKTEEDYHYGASQVHDTPEHISGSDFDIVEELPGTSNANADWINQYYGNKFVKVARKDVLRDGGRIKRF
ncbi:hypothetical protein ABMA27_001951 [Loxostege sticticalis]|uniref:Osiris 18 n=1 Tax=Loxostege sticticalis TaxID=481309 RepID=A0ABR3HVZ8_LOXSC